MGIAPVSSRKFRLLQYNYSTFPQQGVSILTGDDVNDTQVAFELFIAPHMPISLAHGCSNISSHDALYSYIRHTSKMLFFLILMFSFLRLQHR